MEPKPQTKTDILFTLEYRKVFKLRKCTILRKICMCLDFDASHKSFKIQT